MQSAMQTVPQRLATVAFPIGCCFVLYFIITFLTLVPDITHFFLRMTSFSLDVTKVADDYTSQSLILIVSSVVFTLIDLKFFSFVYFQYKSLPPNLINNLMGVRSNTPDGQALV